MTRRSEPYATYLELTREQILERTLTHIIKKKLLGAEIDHWDLTLLYLLKDDDPVRQAYVEVQQ